MTRVNIGIPVSHLCDQHCFAEYRELPRCFSTTPMDVSKNPMPMLKTGHMKWCAAYQGSLIQRQRDLIAELLYRGCYDITHREVDLPPDLKHSNPLFWSKKQDKFGFGILVDRINERLEYMQTHAKQNHRPRWTKRRKPKWVSI